MVFVVGLIIATLIPLLFLLAVYRLDLYASSTYQVVALCFGWGIIAVPLAFMGNTLLVQSGLIAEESVTTVGAPIVEEILKALVLFYLVRRPRVTYFVDGAIYGFAAGIGFAVAENYFFIFGDPESALILALARVISTNLIHAVASGLVGISLALSRFEHKSADRWLLMGGGVILSIFLHAIFNRVTVRLGGQFVPLILFSVLISLSGVLLIMGAIRYGLAEQKKWIEEKLGAVDRVTASEAVAVTRLAEAATVLSPIVDQFGSQRGAQLGRLLTLEAQIGIIRKTLDTLADKKSKEEAQKRLSALQTEMEEARQSVGLYGMMILRALYPTEDRTAWSRIESVIKERDGGEFFRSVDLLTLSLTSLQRQLMFVFLRATEPLLLAEIGAELEEPHDLADIKLAIQGLMDRSWVVCMKDPPGYRVRMGQSIRQGEGWGIWAALDEPAAGQDPVYANNIWTDLSEKLSERATASSSQQAGLWLDLEKRVHPGQKSK